MIKAENGFLRGDTATPLCESIRIIKETTARNMTFEQIEQLKSEAIKLANNGKQVDKREVDDLASQFTPKISD